MMAQTTAQKATMVTYWSGTGRASSYRGAVRAGHDECPLSGDAFERWERVWRGHTGHLYKPAYYHRWAKYNAWIDPQSKERLADDEITELLAWECDHPQLRLPPPGGWRSPPPGEPVVNYERIYFEQLRSAPNVPSYALDLAREMVVDQGYVFTAPCGPPRFLWAQAYEVPGGYRVGDQLRLQLRPDSSNHFYITLPIGAEGDFARRIAGLHSHGLLQPALWRFLTLAATPMPSVDEVRELANNPSMADLGPLHVFILRFFDERFAHARPILPEEWEHDFRIADAFFRVTYTHEGDGTHELKLRFAVPFVYLMHRFELGNPPGVEWMQRLAEMADCPSLWHTLIPSGWDRPEPTIAELESVNRDAVQYELEVANPGHPLALLDESGPRVGFPPDNGSSWTAWLCMVAFGVRFARALVVDEQGLPRAKFLTPSGACENRNAWGGSGDDLAAIPQTVVEHAGDAVQRTAVGASISARRVAVEVPLWYAELAA